MQHDLHNGLVIRVTGSEIWVEIDGNLVPCLLRGRFRRRSHSVRVAAGDRVSVALPAKPGESGAIEGVEDRTSWLSRYNERENAERIIVANVETLFVVAALKTPPLHMEFIDRVLVSAERGGVRAKVVANKTDLAVDDADAERQLGDLTTTYRACGYEVMPVSAQTGDGIDGLAATVENGVYAFAGESGVGKTSLLMKIDPKLDLKVREVGEKTGRGRHTTTYSQLYPFRDGYLADTPGVQTFAFPGTDKEELADCFPEVAAHAECKFRPCTHSHEPQCGVKDALDAGSIPQSRHTSYLHLLEEIEERGKRRQW
jgi:ribosome biogenesis GTPase